MNEKILLDSDDIQKNLSKLIDKFKLPLLDMNYKEKEGYKKGVLAAKSVIHAMVVSKREEENGR